MSYGQRVDEHQHSSYDVYGVAQEHHEHYDLKNRIDGLRADLNGAHERIGWLEDQIAELLEAARNGVQ